MSRIPPTSDRLRVGVSACLAGQNVRFDGQAKRNDYVNDVLGRYVELVPVCPELAIGLGVPRESVHLERDREGPRLIGQKSRADHTEAMRRFSERYVDDMVPEMVGFILKSDSPSCGMERVKVYPRGGEGMPRRDGVGLFARVLVERFPLLPVEEEGRLNDEGLRENFVIRLFALHRARSFFGGRWTTGQLIRFHAEQKMLLLAHDPPSYQRLGRLVAKAKEYPRGALADVYVTQYMQALKKHATRGKHVNVLQHMAGYFRRVLDAPARRELEALIEEYERGLVPLIAPLTLLRHYMRLHRVEYLSDQVYLEPHPKELLLRNHP